MWVGDEEEGGGKRNEEKEAGESSENQMCARVHAHKCPCVGVWSMCGVCVCVYMYIHMCIHACVRTYMC